MRILSFDVGIVNLAYCVWDTELLKIKHWEIIALENTSDHAKLHVNLIRQLDSRRDHLINGIDIVIIEKQPSFNPKMRIIGSCLQTYFFIRGMVDSNISIENSVQNISMKAIKFFSPKHKLKCHNGPELVVNGKSKYLRTKKMGILICNEKLREYNETPENIELFEKSKKKDDLADCYLQAITYALFEKFIKKSPVSTQLLQPSSPKCFTKVEIKTQLKKIIIGIEPKSLDDIMECFEGLSERLIYSIKEKFGIVTPIDKESLIKLLSELSMKKFIHLDKKTNCSLQVSSVL